MNEQMRERLHDLRQAWVAIQEAAQEEQHAELTEIAISLYGQLGEARAEAARLRALLHRSFGALSPAGLSDA